VAEDFSKFTAGIFIPRQDGRSIGGIPAQVVIEELERDELTITEHPVEQGAPIADHAFKRPSEVTIRAGWSAAIAGDLSANGSGVYGILLQMQAALQPFNVFTGKRSYKDMLIQSLSVETDEKSEYALMATITCRQIIIVTTSVTSTTGASSDSANHTDPQSTGPGVNNGSQQVTSAGFSPSGDARERAAISGPGITVSGDTRERASITLENTFNANDSGIDKGFTPDPGVTIEDITINP
jgi:hypothetical protein